MTRKNWKRATLTLMAALLSLAFINQVRADYASTIMAESDLFAYWRFDQDTGAVGTAAIDELGNNNGTYQVAAATITAAGEGAPIGDATNRAVDFSGIAGYIQTTLLSGFGSSLGDGATIEMWVNSELGPTGADQVPFGLYCNSANNLFIDLEENPNGWQQRDDQIRVYSSWTAGGAGFDTDVTNGTWTYLAVCLNTQNPDAAERLKIYIAQPGETVTTEYTVNTLDAITPPNQTSGLGDFTMTPYIGALNSDGTTKLPFEGQIDELALYTSVLSKSQLDAHLAATASVPEPTTFVLLLGMGFALLLWKRNR